MSKSKGSLLLVEDDATVAASLKKLLESQGFLVHTCAHGGDAAELAASQSIDVVVSDIYLPGLNGLELMQRLHETNSRLPVILMTAQGTMEMAIEATKNGAYDYLLKPFAPTALLELLDKAVRTRRISADQLDLGGSDFRRDVMIGSSPEMQQIFKEIGRVAAKNVTVLIRGETGTGKELVARALVQHSDRAKLPFVTVNCAAIPETLLESELFGHERGAFTGAEARRIGRFEQAADGTIFLDEIGELSAGTQAKLLRALQERTIQRLGGKDTIKVHCRVLAATHLNLEHAVAHHSFREDLFYRLAVVVIQVPPLRERRTDIPDLIRYFLHRCGRELMVENPAIETNALHFFESQEWPGNVRQLENSIRKALLSARGYPIDLEVARQCIDHPLLASSSPHDHLDPWVAGEVAAAARGEQTAVLTQLVARIEELAYRHAIDAAAGNQSKAAAWLGVSLPTMRERLHTYGLHPHKHPT